MALTNKARMARILMDIGAVGARPDRPFTLTSGTLSPVYIDARRLISFVTEREQAVGMMKDMILSTVGGDLHAVAGGETAGIPYAAFLAWDMRLPMLYVRKAPKGFGRDAQVEGRVEEGSSVVLVEDLMFDGGSKIRFVEGLRNAGLKVKHVFVMASYGFEGEYERILGAHGIESHALTDWPTIVNEGEKSGYFTQDESHIIRDFLDDPKTWSSKHNKG